MLTKTERELLMQLQSDIERYLGYRRLIAKRMPIEAPMLIDHLTQTMSLRKLARKIDRSACYLSAVRTGRVICSPEVFLRLMSVWEKSS